MSSVNIPNLALAPQSPSALLSPWVCAAPSAVHEIVHVISLSGMLKGVSDPGPRPLYPMPLLPPTAYPSFKRNNSVHNYLIYPM